MVSNLLMKINSLYVKFNIGTSHGDDTIMVLSTDIDITSTESDKAMSQLLQGMWTSFAQSRYIFVTNLIESY